MQVLDDLHNEINRLFIAGSRFAKGDPRIAKQIPVLEKMGERAPVLKKLAEKTAVLTETGTPEALTDAGTFLYAVMATQGICLTDGEEVIREPAIYELPVTGASYLRIKPVLEAMENSKPGRMEVVKNAFEEGLLNDFRLHAPLASGLDDKYAEFTDYLYKTVIPSIGRPMIPYLLEQYDPKGKKGDAMRLALLGALGCEDAERIAFAAIEEGEPLIAVEGIKLLGKNAQNEEFLLKLAGDKKAAIREAALVGLVTMDSEQGKALMLETLSGAKYKNAVPAARVCTCRNYTAQILVVVKSQYIKLKTADDSVYQDENNRLYELFPALAQKNDREVYDFYIEVMNDSGYTKPVRKNKIQSYQFQDVRHLIRDDLLNAPEDEALRIYERTMSADLAHEVSALAGNYFYVACRRYDPEKLLDVFREYYETGLIDFALMTRSESFVVNPRWKKLFILKKDMSAISALLREDDPLAADMKNAVLAKIKECSVNKKSDRELGRAVARFAETTPKKNGVLFKGELGKLADACYTYFERMDGYMMQEFYSGIGPENFIKVFHPGYAGKFRALVKYKNHRVYQTMAEALETVEAGHQG